MEYSGRLQCLLKKFPRANLGIYPTPLQQLHRLGERFYHNSVWIKRDDLTGLALGGNKARSLEFLLGDALLKKATVIVASGQLQSNLCCLTGAAAKKVGLKCIIVHNNDEPEELMGNALLNNILGCEILYVGNVDEETRSKSVEEIAKDLRKSGEKPYIIYNGASTALGALGYVWASLELYKQCNDNDISIKHVFMPGGNGGTVSGLIFGSGLLGIPFHINVISVEHTKEQLHKILHEFIAELEELFGILLPCSLNDIMTIYDNYRGWGWGQPTEESLKIIYELARLEGIFVEKVYTSKTLVGMLDIISKKDNMRDSGVCFWHTGGIPSLFSQFLLKN